MCRSTLGIPITSLRPSPSRSATAGGEAVHCSQAWSRRARPRAGVPVVVAPLDPGIGPPDELAPAHPPALRVGLPVGEPGRGEDRGAVEVEGVDLVVVEGGDDLEVGVVVDVADGDVLAVRAVAVVAHPVEARSRCPARPAGCSGATRGSGRPPAGRARRSRRTRRPGRRSARCSWSSPPPRPGRRRRGRRPRARVPPATGRRSSWTPATRPSGAARRRGTRTPPPCPRCPPPRCRGRRRPRGR